ncbi:hypothetical protein TrVGV298_004333 [Trichoderma virens]|nr:hypothetical protein TrVGV298_004333 [Trichoderma virens]
MNYNVETSTLADTSTADSPGRAFIRAFFSTFDSITAFQRRPFPIARLIYTEVRRVEREVEGVIEDDERETDGRLHLLFRSTLRVTRNDGIVVKIRQLILMKLRPRGNNLDHLYLDEMHTTTILVESYPNGDEVGEPMEEDDL